MAEKLESGSNYQIVYSDESQRSYRYQRMTNEVVSLTTSELGVTTNVPSNIGTPEDAVEMSSTK